MQSKSFCRTLRVFQASDRCLRLGARAGRYDSTERHCINCEGYNRLRSENPAVAFGPFCITRDEFLDVKEHRKNLKRDREANAPPLVHAVISRLAHKSGNHPSPVSTNLSSSSQPQQFEQPLAPEHIYWPGDDLEAQIAATLWTEEQLDMVSRAIKNPIPPSFSDLSQVGF